MDHMASIRSELASVIVPCWNQLEFTRHCIAALMRCTRSPWELIVVNNGSADGTTATWRACKMRRRCRSQSLRNRPTSGSQSQSTRD